MITSLRFLLNGLCGKNKTLHTKHLLVLEACSPTFHALIITVTVHQAGHFLQSHAAVPSSTENGNKAGKSGSNLGSTAFLSVKWVSREIKCEGV